MLKAASRSKGLHNSQNEIKEKFQESVDSLLNNARDACKLSHACRSDIRTPYNESYTRNFASIPRNYSDAYFTRNQTSNPSAPPQTLPIDSPSI